MLCRYGCRQEAKFRLKNGKWCCNKSWAQCLEVRKKSSESHRGKSTWNKGRTEENDERVKNQVEKRKGRTKENDESRRKQAEKLTGRTKETHEGIRRQAEKSRQWMKNGGAKYLNSFPRDPEKMRKRSEKERQRMLNGGAHIALKGVKNPSGPELKLRGIVKELYSTSEHTYKVLNYDVDVALSEYKIAIEYDGWHHFDTEEHKEYHKKRQQEIEQEGWRFVRYTMFDKFPSREKVLEDIQNLQENLE